MKLLLDLLKACISKVINFFSAIRDMVEERKNGKPNVYVNKSELKQFNSGFLLKVLRGDGNHE